eukprot:TRINITY_DN19845_c0_g1_i4.p1 TRINITY_DN19845_c0_g1~~TRINITY_DN19845_c0_g1_i4.p1  ORF type:complete len:281 (+),score=78.70 TRINITY_DN19845_c0_g1_i4:102-944(+)
MPRQVLLNISDDGWVNIKPGLQGWQAQHGRHERQEWHEWYGDRWAGGAEQKEAEKHGNHFEKKEDLLEKMRLSQVPPAPKLKDLEKMLQSELTQRMKDVEKLFEERVSCAVIDAVKMLEQKVAEMVQRQVADVCFDSGIMLEKIEKQAHQTITDLTHMLKAMEGQYANVAAKMDVYEDRFCDIEENLSDMVTTQDKMGDTEALMKEVAWLQVRSVSEVHKAFEKISDELAIQMEDALHELYDISQEARMLSAPKMHGSGEPVQPVRGKTNKRREGRGRQP